MNKVKGYALILLAALMLNSCATILVAGKADECQRTKPAPGQPQREVRVGYLILDILLLGLPFTIVDFATGEIYKNCQGK
jgi:PBP1b-binding outer membrane lipoprotein LpoB